MQGIALAMGISLLVGLVSGGGVTGWVTHKLDKVQYNQLKADVAIAQAKALQQAEALRTQYETKRQAEAQQWDSQRQALENQARSANQKVERYVRTKPSDCITYGALRLLDGEGIVGGGAERLPLPAGKSNDSCAPITAVVFYRSLLTDLAACRQNTAQLTALISSWRDSQEKIKQSAGKK